MDDDLTPLRDQIACVEREIYMREQVYPRLVGQRKRTKEWADKELALMRAVLNTLKARQV